MDQENFKQIAGEVMTVVADKVGKAAEAAGKAATKAAGTASEVAGDLSHRAAELGKVGIEVATPVVIKVAEATEVEARKLLERTREAAAKSEQALAQVEQHAKSQKRRGRAGRVVGWTAAAAGVASVAYLLWRRSRPIEDPWAEEYWVDLQSDVDLDNLPEEPVESVSEALDDVVSDVEDGTDSVVEAAEEVLEDSDQ